MSHRIQSLNIKNYRSIKELDIELQNFTPVVGQNNVGKSNILNAIHWFIKGDVPEFVKTAVAGLSSFTCYCEVSQPLRWHRARRRSGATTEGSMPARRPGLLGHDSHALS